MRYCKARTRQLGLGLNHHRCRGVTPSHAGALKEVNDILSLGQVEVVGGSSERDGEEVV